MVLGFSTLMALVFVWQLRQSARDCLVIPTIRGWSFSGAGANGDRLGQPVTGADKGFRDAAGNALSLIVGSLIGFSRTTSVTVWAVMKGRCWVCADSRAGGNSCRHHVDQTWCIPLSYLKPSWDNGLAGQLSNLRSWR